MTFVDDFSLQSISGFMKVEVSTCILFVVLSFVDGATHLRVYDPNQAVQIYGHEPPYIWNTWAVYLLDPELDTWGFGGSGLGYAPYLGQLIAGQAEFPWLVDVRNLDHDQEGWAVGNLVNRYWVLTVAHIAAVWRKADDECGPSKQEQYVVYFCANYLQENWVEYNLLTHLPVHNLFRGRDAQGTRTIVEFLRHPQCTRWSREWDGMMVKMNHPIDPVPPVVGYMPLWGTFQGFFPDGDYTLIPKVDIQNHEIEGELCYVATYGRSLYNIARPPSQDWKNKYRVYFARDGWDTCRRVKRDLCTKVENLKSYIDDVCEFFFDNGAEIYGMWQYSCFEMRSPNGAICEHDVGAPLICSDMVAGIVVRGAPFSHCRSGKPYPFVIIRIDTFNRGFLNAKNPGPNPQYLPPGPSTPWPIVQGGNTHIAPDAPGAPTLLK